MDDKDPNVKLTINKNKTRTETERENMNKDSKETEKEKKKEIVPIVPYKVDTAYQNKLLSALKKQNRLRPKNLFSQDFEDITEAVMNLDKKETIKDEQHYKEDEKAQQNEKEDKLALASYKQSSLSGTTILQDPYALFAGAEQAYIDQYYKISDLFVICPLYFNYRISLEYCVSQEPRTLEAYHLFTTKEITPSCSHNCLPNQSRQIDVNIFNYIVDPKDKEMQKFVTIKKPCRCALACFCACCSRPTFQVETPIETLGKIVELRTICDPVLHVMDINDEIVYIIKASCCQCGYCLRDACCNNHKCAECQFEIYDKNNKGKGIIKKVHRSGKKVQPDYDQLIITFPPDASCQEKILIMCATLAIEYLYFQNLSNSRKCSGVPKYLNIPPY